MGKVKLLIFLSFYLIFSCKDYSKSNTGSPEYDKLMNKKDIILEEENNKEKALESADKDASIDKTKPNFYSDVQFINGTPISRLSSGYKIEEHALFLAATKLCWLFDYKETLGESRKGNYKNGKERIKITSCCGAFVPSPYISPFEYYYSLYHGNKDIVTYKNNVFKLKEIRENLMAENFESFKNIVQDAEVENLSSYTLTSSSIQNYNFEKSQLEIRYYINNNLKVGSSKASMKSSGRRYRSSSFTHLIDMTDEQAKAIYEHYASLNEYSKNPPFQLTTKTTYALGIPKIEKRPYNFELTIKNIEFFKTGDGYPEPSDKIGEIQFIEQFDEKTNI